MKPDELEEGEPARDTGEEIALVRLAPAEVEAQAQLATLGDAKTPAGLPLPQRERARDSRAWAWDRPATHPPPNKGWG